MDLEATKGCCDFCNEDTIVYEAYDPSCDYDGSPYRRICATCADNAKLAITIFAQGQLEEEKKRIFTRALELLLENDSKDAVNAKRNLESLLARMESI